jgi:hypothetical protein
MESSTGECIMDELEDYPDPFDEVFGGITTILDRREE